MFRWWSNLEDEFRIAQRALMGNGSSSAKPLKRGRKKLEDVRNVNQLRDVVLSLDKVTAQQRGYRFEEVVARLCELTSGIAKLNVWKRGRDDDHNQIDVYFRFKRAGGGEIPFYVECKWESTAANKDQLEKFHTALGSTQYGLFISMGGFEETGIRRARRLAQDKPILLVDGKEMMAVLDGRIPFKVLLDTKIRYLEEISEPYYSLVIEEHEPSY